MIADQVLKKLKYVFDSYAQNNYITIHQARQAAWEFDIYPSMSQVLEIILFQTDQACKGIQFHEFCILVAALKSEIQKVQPIEHLPKIHRSVHISAESSRCDVFLGGACNPTTWRSAEAIPFLHEHGISFYNPQIDNWKPEMIKHEADAMVNSQVLLFVVTWATRGLASLVEAAHFCSQGLNLVLVLPYEPPPQHSDGQITVNGEILQLEEFQSIRRGHLFLMDLVERQGIPVFSSLTVALNCVKEIIDKGCHVRDLTEKSGAIPVRHPYIKLGQTMVTLEDVYRLLLHKKKEHITQLEAEEGLSVLLGRPCINDGSSASSLHELSSDTGGLTFPDFCRLYAREVFNDDPSDLQLVADDAGQQETTRKILRSATDQSEKGQLTTDQSEIRKSTTDQSVSSEPTTDNQPDCCEKPRLHYSYDVFLGGSCGTTNWRKSVAIPLLRGASMSFYDPQAAEWTARLLPEDAEARLHSRVVLFVISRDTFSTASVVEAAHLIGLGHRVVLYLELLEPPSCIGTPRPPPGSPPPSLSEQLSGQAILDHNRARQCLKFLAIKTRVPIADSLKEAVHMCVDEVARMDSTN